MSRTITKLKRFLWRAANNLLAAIPLIRRLRFPAVTLARSFGSDDASYSWRVFERHAKRLRELDFPFDARRILEVGPGQNIGGPVLWWAVCGGEGVHVTLWDAFPNMAPDKESIRATAGALLETADGRDGAWPELCARLRSVVAGEIDPEIDYVVCDLAGFTARGEAPYDLLLSHSALEHVWSPEPTVRMLAEHTSDRGWHSMQIDLMDHGSRETNYLEMLEWSDFAYWLTMRFAPGGLNRWRAQEFIDLYEALGLETVASDRRVQDALPTRREHLGRRFRAMTEAELLTSELFLISCGHRSRP